MTEPEDLLRSGQLDAALAALQAKVRAQPADSKLRVFLFQLLCVLGEWDRARAQLKVLSELDAGALALVHVYGSAITCEVLRREVFAGARTPLVLGEPLSWVALLLEALAVAAKGQERAATTLRKKAFDEAAAVPGSIDGEAFAWIADADSRLGPLCEAVVEGRYYWIPFERIKTLTVDEPADLRDRVWMPVHVLLTNGGEVAALVPTRYPGSESDKDDLIKLARKTTWDEIAPDTVHGRGQRMFTTDVGEHALMTVRRIELGVAEAESG
jgi:type VI secretion system protein ImpE